MSNLLDICSTNIEMNITITNARLFCHGRLLCDPFVKVNEANIVVSRFNIIRQTQVRFCFHVSHKLVYELTS